MGPKDQDGGKNELAIDDFLVDPPRKVSDWRWLWEGDHRFPIRSHRPGFLGRLVVLWKRLLAPLVRIPQNDLWDRQRVFNLILLEYLERVVAGERGLKELEARVRHIEAFMTEGLNEVMRHNDALFSRVDQKLDRYRATAQEHASRLQSALAVAERASTTEGDGGDESAPAGVERLEATSGPPGQEALTRLRQETAYLELENRYRGTSREIEERFSRYLPLLEDREPVLDLGCGRGEALAVLKRHGIAASGVDASSEMVRHCAAQGLAVEQGDLLEILARQAAGSLGAIVSLHVVEHLPSQDSIDLLVRLGWRALRSGGVLIVETPNPLSVLVTASSFWLDPTHQRPVHPESLKLTCRLAGFEDVRQLDLHPFPASKHLPEIDLAKLPEAQRALGDRVNRLRDRLDEMLFGHQDYAVVGVKKAVPAGDVPRS